jgi:hypothetical protein
MPSATAPITAGDRLATTRDAAAELRIGSTSIRLSEATEVELQRLDDERVRLQLHRGSIAVRLRSREVAAETDFGTAEAWLRPQRSGLYRLDRDDDTTYAASWRGELVVDEAPSLVVEAGRRLQLWREGPQGLLQTRWSQPVDDAFAAQVLRDDRADERSASAAYVPTEMTGWEELDRHGRWDQHPEYGAVWLPHQRAGRLGALPPWPLGMGATLGLDLDRRRALGFCALPLRPLVHVAQPLGLGAGAHGRAAGVRPGTGGVDRRPRPGGTHRRQPQLGAAGAVGTVQALVRRQRSLPRPREHP